MLGIRPTLRARRSLLDLIRTRGEDDDNSQREQGSDSDDDSLSSGSGARGSRYRGSFSDRAPAPPVNVAAVRDPTRKASSSSWLHSRAGKAVAAALALVDVARQVPLPNSPPPSPSLSPSPYSPSSTPQPLSQPPPSTTLSPGSTASSIRPQSPHSPTSPHLQLDNAPVSSLKMPPVR